MSRYNDNPSGFKCPVEFKAQRVNRLSESEIPSGIGDSERHGNAEAKLAECFPDDTEVPNPFKKAFCQDYKFGSHSKTEDADGEYREGWAVTALYTPSGTHKNTNCHLGARITIPGIDSSTAIDTHFDEICATIFQDQTADQQYTDWVREEKILSQTEYGPRMSYRWQRPILVAGSFGNSTERPVSNHAFVVQKTDWGVVTACAQLQPEPDYERTNKYAGYLLDEIVSKINILQGSVRDTVGMRNFRL